MNKITIDFNETTGKVKPMHAVNNGPAYKHGTAQRLTNLGDFIEAGIPYQRNHDASFCSTYGGNHTVDVNFIFTDFDADPYDAKSYDFACTDEYIRVCELAGVKTFYRLGSRIEHEIKKYNTLPPKDFKKWAIICEHIIKHYCYGWADGFHYDIEYWEIWNEPEVDSPSNPDKRCWGGTAEEFYEFFDVALGHLKECFPKLKIGGPAMSWFEDPDTTEDIEQWQQERADWLKGFMSAIKTKPDFFSWHRYSNSVEGIAEKIVEVKNFLDRYGWSDVESILNEWNYVKGWEEERFLHTIRAIPSIKGAAFTAGAMCVGQNLPLDMLMYYDARPCGFNGLWAPYTFDRLKGYYPFVAFNTLYKLATGVKAEVEGEWVYACGAKDDKNGAVMIAQFCDDALVEKSEIELYLKGVSEGEEIEIYMLDENHDLELVEKCGYKAGMKLEMPLYSVMLIKMCL